MPKIKKKNLLKVLVFLPYLLILYILQGMVFSRVLIFGSKPLILPLFVAGTALFGGRVPGGITGIFAGMLCDISFNQSTIQFTIILTVLGLVIGYLSDAVMTKGFPSYLVISAAILIVCSLCQIFPLVFFYGAPIVPILHIALRQTLVSLIFVIPIYYISRFISRLA